MTMKKTCALFPLFMALLLLAACEKVSIDDLNKEDPEERNDGVKLTFRVMSFEQTRFNDPTTVTRAAVRDVCDKINLALYDMENNRLKAVNQKADDENFGSLSLSIEPGTYRVLILAHSCSGNATTTNIEKITFPDNKVTDTFYYCAEIEVDDQKTYDVELRRVVAMFKLVVAALHCHKLLGYRHIQGQTGYYAQRSDRLRLCELETDRDS